MTSEKELKLAEKNIFIHWNLNLWNKLSLFELLQSSEDLIKEETVKWMSS